MAAVCDSLSEGGAFNRVLMHYGDYTFDWHLYKCALGFSAPSMSKCLLRSFMSTTCHFTKREAFWIFWFAGNIPESLLLFQSLSLNVSELFLRTNNCIAAEISRRDPFQAFRQDSETTALARWAPHLPNATDKKIQSEESVAVKPEGTTRFLPREHLTCSVQTIIPTLSLGPVLNTRVSKCWGTYRDTRHISSCPEPCFQESIIRTRRRKRWQRRQQSATGNESTTAGGVPFGTGGCTGAWKLIWTWGQMRWCCSPSGCVRRRNEPGVSLCVFCTEKKKN